jgi:hypothetical protein
MTRVIVVVAKPPGIAVHDHIGQHNAIVAALKLQAGKTGRIGRVFHEQGFTDTADAIPTGPGPCGD